MPKSMQGDQDTPWAVRPVKRVKGTKTVVERVEPVHKPKKTPWAPPSPPASPTAQDLPELRSEKQEDDRRPSPEPKKQTSQKRVAPGGTRVAASHYVAKEATAGLYGIIDPEADGGQARHEKTLLVHVPRQHKDPWRVLSQIRPGATLSVKALQHGAPARQLRVLFTTPARYYPPGQKVSTLTVGVLGADWSAMTDAASGI